MKKNKGKQFEKKVAQTINSGAMWFNKGDLQTKDYVIECKFTEKKGYRISTKLLNKLWKDALEANKLPLLTIGIKEGNELWVIKCQIEKEIR